MDEHHLTTYKILSVMSRKDGESEMEEIVKSMCGIEWPAAKLVLEAYACMTSLPMWHRSKIENHYIKIKKRLCSSMLS